jgi:DNA repair protein RadC
MVRPRERLLARGVESLSDAELVAVILGTGRAGEGVTLLAERLLLEHGGLAGLRRKSPRELERALGIGPVKAARLVAALEAGIRALSPRGTVEAPLRDSQAVFERYGRSLVPSPIERFVVVAVDAKNRPRAERTVALGGRVSCQVDPSEVFRWLVAESAAGAVFLHNHPSGDPEPSTEDVRLTARLVDAGTLLQIRVLDHLIVGDGRYRSLRDAGLWPSSAVKSGRSSD